MGELIQLILKMEQKKLPPLNRRVAWFLRLDRNRCGTEGRYSHLQGLRYSPSAQDTACEGTTQVLKVHSGHAFK